MTFELLIYTISILSIFQMVDFWEIFCLVGKYLTYFQNLTFCRECNDTPSLNLKHYPCCWTFNTTCESGSNEVLIWLQSEGKTKDFTDANRFWNVGHLEGSSRIPGWVTLTLCLSVNRIVQKNPAVSSRSILEFEYNILWEKLNFFSMLIYSSIRLK